MLPKPKKYSYHNESLQSAWQRLTEELSTCCLGENIPLSALTGTSDGQYSEENTRALIHDVIDCISYDFTSFTPDQRSWLEALFYVSIRTLQANPHYILVPEEDAFFCSEIFLYNEPPLESDLIGILADSLSSRVLHLDLNLEFPDLEYRLPVSPILAYAAFTLYYHLTGTLQPFPSPYPSCSEVLKEQFGTIDEAYERSARERERMEHWLPDSELSEEEEKEVNAWMDHISEMQQDPDFIEDERKEADAMKEHEERFLFDRTLPENRRLLKQQADEFSFYFENQQEFVTMYEQLIRLTKPEYQQFFRREEHSGGSLLHHLLTLYLKHYGLTIFSYDDEFSEIFYLLYKAQKLVKEKQEKLI